MQKEEEKKYEMFQEKTMKQSIFKFMPQAKVEDEGLEDVTEIFNKGLQNIKEDDCIKTSEYFLEKTMSAIEIGHKKMDYRLNIFNCMNPKRALKEKIIKPPIELTLSEIIGFLDQMKIREIQFFSGSSVAQTIFTSLYTIDLNFCQENKILFAAGMAANYLIYCLYHIIQKITFLRDDDINICNISPTFGNIDLNKLSQIIIEGEHFVDTLVKNAANQGSKEELKKKSEAIKSRLKLYRGLTKILDSIISGKDKELDQNFEFCIKQAKIAEQTIELGTNCEAFFSDLMIQTFPMYVHIKRLPNKSLKEVYEDVLKMVYSIQELRSKSSSCNYYDIGFTLSSLVKKGQILFTKMIFEFLIFPEGLVGIEDIKKIKFCGSIPLREITEKIIFNETREYVNENINNFLKHATLALKELLLLILRSIPRQRRLSNKFLHNFSGILQFANIADTEILGSNPKFAVPTKTKCVNLIISFITELMISYINKGFELGMYPLCEGQYLNYYLNTIELILFNNYRIKVITLGKNIISDNNEMEYNQLQVKKLSASNKHIFDLLYIYKAKMLIHKGLWISMMCLQKKGLIEESFKGESAKDVYMQRFKNFVNVPFPYFKTYEDFLDESSKIYAIGEEAVINEAIFNYNEAKLVITDVKARDPSLRNVEMIPDTYLDEMIKCCISNSLAIQMYKIYKQDSKIRIQYNEQIELNYIYIEKKK